MIIGAKPCELHHYPGCFSALRCDQRDHVGLCNKSPEHFHFPLSIPAQLMKPPRKAMQRIAGPSASYSHQGRKKERKKRTPPFSVFLSLHALVFFSPSIHGHRLGADSGENTVDEGVKEKQNKR